MEFRRIRNRRFALALVALGVSVAGATISGASGAASAASYGTSAVQVQSAAAATISTVRVVTHNVQRRSNVVDVALAKAQEKTAPVVLLQEVCESDMRRIVAAHPDWTVAWKAYGPYGSCSSSTGNVAIWRGGNGGTVRTLTYDNQFTKDNGERESRGLACVFFKNDEFRACSVHLAVSDSKGPRNLQAAQTKQFVAPWVASDKVVVLGGDFNAAPDDATMDRFYRNDGGGDFFEVTRTGTGAVCRCGGAGGGYTNNPDQDGFDRKIDYIFISANAWSSSRAADHELTTTDSDHRMLYGYGQIVR